MTRPHRAQCRRRLLRWVAAPALATLSSLAPAPACPLALVLALDASSSVDEREYRLQRDGLATALADEEVVEAIVAQGGIWVTAFEWSGAWQQYDWLGWTFLDDAASVRRAAARLGGASRQSDGFPTALGYALGYALAQLRHAPEPCARQVIDVAGDGINNHGFPPGSVYRANDLTGVTVNALVIEGATPPPAPYYRAQVIRGPGAFVEVTADFADYTEAMRRKLLREIPAQYVMLR